MTTAIQGVELFVDVHTELGEGPLWDPERGCLFFVDILKGRVHRCAHGSRTVRTYEIGQPVGALGLAERGDLILAVRDGFARLDLEDGRVSMIAEVERDRPDQRMNDGRCDAHGCFWAGTMALDEHAGAGALYRLGPDLRVETMIPGVTISNGVDWTDDGRRMYYVDTGALSIDLIDVEPTTGAISNRRTFATVSSSDGAPDGLVLDADGFVWVALWGGGAVRRYAPDGSLDRVIRLPATYVTACTFGGPDLADLFITTASIKLSDEERAREPGAGGLFRCRPGVRGRRPHRFRG